MTEAGSVFVKCNCQRRRVKSPFLVLLTYSEFSCQIRAFYFESNFAESGDTEALKSSGGYGEGRVSESGLKADTVAAVTSALPAALLAMLPCRGGLQCLYSGNSTSLERQCFQVRGV